MRSQKHAVHPRTPRVFDCISKTVRFVPLERKIVIVVKQLLFRRLFCSSRGDIIALPLGKYISRPTYKQILRAAIMCDTVTVSRLLHHHDFINPLVHETEGNRDSALVDVLSYPPPVLGRAGYVTLPPLSLMGLDICSYHPSTKYCFRKSDAFCRQYTY